MGAAIICRDTTGTYLLEIEETRQIETKKSIYQRLLHNDKIEIIQFNDKDYEKIKGNADYVNSAYG